MVDFIKKASLNMNFLGFKGRYGFEKDGNAMVVSKAFLPNVFAQFIIKDRSDVDNLDFSIRNVLYHRMDDGMNLYYMDTFQWKTFNGKPPKDTVTLSYETLPMLPLAANAVLKAINCFAIIVQFLGSLFFIFYLKTSSKYMFVTIALGNLCLLGHI